MNAISYRSTIRGSRSLYALSVRVNPFFMPNPGWEKPPAVRMSYSTNWSRFQNHKPSSIRFWQFPDGFAFARIISTCAQPAPCSPSVSPSLESLSARAHPPIQFKRNLFLTRVGRRAGHNRLEQPIANLAPPPAALPPIGPGPACCGKWPPFRAPMSPGSGSRQPRT
jgi:hypothetical protein